MKHFLRQNGLLLLIIALLLSVLIGIVSAVMGGNADPLSNAVGFITTPIRNGVSAVLDWADGVRAYVFHYEEMEQQIQDLERQVAELEEQAREGQEASRENEQSVDAWLDMVQDYYNLEELDRPTLVRLIQKIEVGEKRMVDGHEERDFNIYYNFIGHIDL